MKSRTKGRDAALKVLYELDQTDHLLGNVLEMRCQEDQLDDDLVEFTRLLVQGVRQYYSKLDEFIAQYAKEWPVDQVAVIDRNILRIALWEVAIYRKTPLKVAINEAIELAKTYGSETSSKFINGVLGSLADHLEEIIPVFD